MVDAPSPQADISDRALLPTHAYVDSRSPVGSTTTNESRRAGFGGEANVGGGRQIGVDHAGRLPSTDWGAT